MKELIAKDGRNAELIHPYLSGEELNDSPTHSHHRYVINFGTRDEEDAWTWPDLMNLVQVKVKEYRDKSNSTSWWQFERPRSEMLSRMIRNSKIIANSCVSSHFAMTQIPTSVIPAHTINLFLDTSFASFCTLQSSIHEVWTRFFASSLEDRLRYNLSDCFETFPFPEKIETNPTLEAAGQAYYEFRAELMDRNIEGLTKTYNRFHHPNETSADIKKLRELHAAMDRAVLDAYGGELAKLTVPLCEFLLDYEDEEEDESGEPQSPTGRQRKKPWRYRWPDAFRDEVLALLLELNKQRAEEEKREKTAAQEASGGAATGRTRARRTSRTGTANTDESGQPKLPGT